MAASTWDIFAAKHYLTHKHETYSTVTLYAINTFDACVEENQKSTIII